MKLSCKHILLLGLLLASSMAKMEAQDSLRIWDDLKLKTYQLEIPSEVSWVIDGRERVKEVEEPMLYKFLPEPGLAKGTAVIICPGGGYYLLSMSSEGFEVARRLQAQGIAAFVLKSRLPNPKHWKNATYAPLKDLDKAFMIIEKNAKDWRVDKNRIGVIGFSAGGHLAASLNIPNLLPDRLREKEFPAFSALVYPVISMMDELTHQGSQHNLLSKNAAEGLKEKFSGELNTHPNMGPTFLVHAVDDHVVKVDNVLTYASAIAGHQGAVEMKIYAKGGHGFGIANDQAHLSKWMTDFEDWLKYIYH